MLRIRIGFYADPDQAFYLNAGSQTNADPDLHPGHKKSCRHKKLDFDMKNLPHLPVVKIL
jgi:hypothetical protein